MNINSTHVFGVHKKAICKFLKLAVISLFITVFGVPKISAYYSKNIAVSVGFETSPLVVTATTTSNNYTADSNLVVTIPVSIVNSNNYEISYTITLGSSNLKFSDDSTTYSGIVGSNLTSTENLNIIEVIPSGTDLTTIILTVNTPYTKEIIVGTYNLTYDNVAPTVNNIEGGTTLKSATQTLTLKCSDNRGVTAYYYGTTEPTSVSNISTTVDLESLTSGSGLSKTVNQEGTYWIACRDAAGNFSKKSITIRKYQIQPVLEKIAGITGTYTDSNYENVGSLETYYVKNGTTLTSDIYTVPTESGSSSLVGYTNDALSSDAVTPLTTNPVVNADNLVYYVIFNRTLFTVTLVGSEKGSILAETVTQTGNSATSSDTDAVLTVKYGDTVTLTSTPGGGYTFTSWGGDYISGSTNPITGGTITENKTVSATYTGIIYTITLNNQSATTGGTTTAYYRYNTTAVIDGVTCYYYTDATLTTCLTNGHTITKPKKTGYTYGGYFTETGGAGTQYVNASGTFINSIYKTIGDKTLYAKWTINRINVRFNIANGSWGGTTNTHLSLSGAYVAYDGNISYHGVNYGGSYDIPNYNNPDYINMVKIGNSAPAGKQWCTAQNGGGTCYDHSAVYTNVGTDGTASTHFCDARESSCTVTLYVNWKPNTYRIQWDYNENRTYTSGQYLNTGYKINWGRDFKIRSKFRISTAAKRYLIIGNYDSSARTLNIEVNADNKLRVYMDGGAVNWISSAQVPRNTDYIVEYVWTASTNTWTIKIEDLNISGSGTHSMSGTASKALRTNIDHRDTTVFTPITIKSLVITDSRVYDTAYSDLPAATKSGYTFDGWWTGDTSGDQITQSSTVPAENDSYHARWTTSGSSSGGSCTPVANKFKWRGLCTCFSDSLISFYITSPCTYDTQNDAYYACQNNTGRCSTQCSQRGAGYRGWGSCTGYLWTGSN